MIWPPPPCNSCFTIYKLDPNEPSPTYVKDAKHEATMLAALHHPNVVQCYGATVEDAVLHIAMVREQGEVDHEQSRDEMRLCHSE